MHQSMTRVNSLVPLMHLDPDRSWITDPFHPKAKGTQPILSSDAPGRDVGRGTATVEEIGRRKAPHSMNYFDNKL